MELQEIKHFKRCLNETLKNNVGRLKAKKDWQQSKVYNFEKKQYHKCIDESTIQQIGNRIGNLWGIKINCLMPQFDDDYAEAWNLSPTAGVIQIPLNWYYSHYVIHECSHVIVECLKMRKPFKRVKEPGHGAFWAGVNCLNLSKINGENLFDIRYKMEYNGIRVIDLESLENIRKLSRQKII